MSANTLTSEDIAEQRIQRRLNKRQRRAARNGGMVLKPQTMQLARIQPMTENQNTTFESFENGQHLFLHGLAGTGKTFISIYLAFADMMSGYGQQNKLFIVRSVVPTRDMGFLPGSPQEKSKVYEQPYIAICAEIFGRGDAYDVLKQKGWVEFMTTSFIRGITLRDCIVIVDECQNMTDGELHSIMTRIGPNCRIIFSGDIAQDDLSSDRRREYSGISQFAKIIKAMKNFKFVEFGVKDIVRSDIVKEYIIARYELGLS